MTPSLRRALSRADALVILLLGAGLAARLAGLPFNSADTEQYFIPWYQHLTASFSQSIADFKGNYNFPYVYLLWISRLLFGPARALLAIKAVSIIADLGLSAAVALTVKGAGAPISPARAFAIAWCIPTVIINSSWWGQSDAIYTALLIASVAAIMRGRGLAAAALIGIAFSFKLQAIFIAPFVLLLLWDRKLSAAAIAMGLAAVVLMTLPAVWAGRPLSDLALVYVAQTGAYHALALSAPNPWSVLEHVGPVARGYTPAIATGIALAGVGSIAYLVRGKTIGFPQPKYFIEAAFVAVFLCPFLLPKMHERYFFTADVLAATMAMVDRRWIVIAVLVQVGSLSGYSGFLLGVHWPLAIGVGCNTFVFCWIVARWLRLPVTLKAASATPCS